MHGRPDVEKRLNSELSAQDEETAGGAPGTFRHRGLVVYVDDLLMVARLMEQVGRNSSVQGFGGALGAVLGGVARV